jgi:hypothetical protein
VRVHELADALDAHFAAHTAVVEAAERGPLVEVRGAVGVDEGAQQLFSMRMQATALRVQVDRADADPVRLRSGAEELAELSQSALADLRGLHLLESLMDDGFDLTVFQELEVDHGLTVPLSIYCPEPGDAWPCPVVPLMVNVIQYPQPTAARCYALGRAIGRALETFDPDTTVAVFGTGGMSHQLAGARAGFINPDFDAMFLEAIETDPEKLAALSREDYILQAGSEGIEMIMWLIMRGAMNEQIRRVHSTYFVPASNTAAALALFDNRVPRPA